MFADIYYFMINERVIRSLHTKIAIIGGGSGGALVASHLNNYGIATHNDITIFEHATQHHFQSFMSKVGVGLIDLSHPARYTKSMKPIFNNKANFVSHTITHILPHQNTLISTNGRYTYDILVISSGLSTNFSKCSGMEKLPLAYNKDEKYKIGSIYDINATQKMKKALDEFKGGNAIFMQGPPPLKCTGATLQTCLLCEEIFRKKSIKADVKFVVHGKAIFPNPSFNELYTEMFKQKNIQILYGVKLKHITESQAIFEDEQHNVIKEPYNLFHAVPIFEQFSYVPKELLDDKNLVEVNKYTLQHVRYPNVFALGDCSSIPVFKTSASIMYQAPVLVTNIDRYLQKKDMVKYNGHAICPVITRKGRAVFAETIYESQPWSRFLRNPVSESRMYYFAELYLMHHIYLKMAIKGRWYGSNLFIKPSLS